jgi:phosphohistidine phosphatase
MTDAAGSGGKQLWVVRHARAADRPTAGSADRDRPLTERGRADAAGLGARIAAEPPDLAVPTGVGLVRPETVLCSAAERTRTTAEEIAAALVGTVPVDAFRSLYDAEVATVLAYLREIDEHVGSALLVGHNPTVAELAYDLQAPGAPGRRQIEEEGFPPCSLAVLALAVDAWEDVAEGCGTLLGLLRPPW